MAGPSSLFSAVHFCPVSPSLHIPVKHVVATVNNSPRQSFHGALSQQSVSLAANQSPRQSLNGALLSLSASVAVLICANAGAEIASAATIKMGADEGSLVFVPSSVSVSAGEKVVFLNNKGFPHNVIFEKDGVPQNVEIGKISHEDYMNEQGEQFVVILKEKGIYRFFCEPHRAAGMYGEITVT